MVRSLKRNGKKTLFIVKVPIETITGVQSFKEDIILSVAQSGSVARLDRGGRMFESYHSDQILHLWCCYHNGLMYRTVNKVKRVRVSYGKPYY